MTQMICAPLPQGPPQSVPSMRSEKRPCARKSVLCTFDYALFKSAQTDLTASALYACQISEEAGHLGFGSRRVKLRHRDLADPYFGPCAEAG
jgi:hypothetical protein